MVETFTAIKLIHITTVPISLVFFRGQVGYLKARGFQVYAISSPGELATQFAEQEDIPVYNVPMKRALSPFRDLISLFRLYQ